MHPCVVVSMPENGDSNKAKLWRERAEECRSAADGIKDEVSRRQMIGVAESYERMADLADQRANAGKDRKHSPGR
jgi:hypothetical protein